MYEGFSSFILVLRMLMCVCTCLRVAVQICGFVVVKHIYLAFQKQIEKSQVLKATRSTNWNRKSRKTVNYEEKFSAAAAA